MIGTKILQLNLEIGKIIEVKVATCNTKIIFLPLCNSKTYFLLSGCSCWGDCPHTIFCQGKVWLENRKCITIALFQLWHYMMHYANMQIVWNIILHFMTLLLRCRVQSSGTRLSTSWQIPRWVYTNIRRRYTHVRRRYIYTYTNIDMVTVGI